MPSFLFIFFTLYANINEGHINIFTISYLIDNEYVEENAKKIRIFALNMLNNAAAYLLHNENFSVGEAWNREPGRGSRVPMPANVCNAVPSPNAWTPDHFFLAARMPKAHVGHSSGGLLAAGNVPG